MPDDLPSARPPRPDRAPAAASAQQLQRAGLAAVLFSLGLFTVVMVVFQLPPVQAAVESLADWLRGLGPWAAVGYVAVYAGLLVFLIPVSPLAITAGAVFGWLGGVGVIYAGSLLAAAIAFSLGRGAWRRWVERQLAQHPHLRAFDGAVQRQGAWLVVLLRLSPFPSFAVANYLCALSGVRRQHFAVGTLLGSVPGVVV